MSNIRFKFDPSWEPSWARLGAILEPIWGAKLGPNRFIFQSVLRLELEIVSDIVLESLVSDFGAKLGSKIEQKRRRVVRF